MQWEDMTWSHRRDRQELSRMSSAAGDYRKKYLSLRKMVREFVLENDLPVPQDIKKAIGLK